MTLTGNERRMAPRFAVRCAGELAAGTSVVDIVIGDMSVTGCGVEMEGVPEDALGKFGVLSVYSKLGKHSTILFPIVICYNRVEEGRTRLGLKFQPLNMSQAHQLTKFMGEMRPDQ